MKHISDIDQLGVSTHTLHHTLATILVLINKDFKNIRYNFCLQVLSKISIVNQCSNEMTYNIVGFLDRLDLNQ